MNEDLVEVRLVDLPVAVHDRASTHMNALQREFDLIRRRDPDQTTVPHRLQTLIDELADEFGGVGEQPSEALEHAIARGDATVDLVYRLPRSAGAASQRLGDLLDEVDDYCRNGEHLLTLVPTDEAIRYRRWFLSEFVRQPSGEAPIPWPAFSDPRQGAGTSLVEPSPGDPVELPPNLTIEHNQRLTSLTVTGAVDLVSAPALRDALSSLIPGESNVVIDLTGCDFLDSLGVSVLVAALIRAKEHQVAVAFRLSQETERVIRLSGLLDRLVIET